MRRSSMITAALLVLATSGVARADGPTRLEDPGPLRVDASFFAPYVFNPGVRAGVTLPVLTFTRRRGIGATVQTGLVVGAHASYFRRLRVHHSVMVDAELGWRVRRNKRRIHSTFAVGLGLLVERRTLGFAVDLGNGGRAGVDTQARTYAVPMLSYTVGQDNTQRFGWFLRASLGRKFSPSHVNANTYSLELGVHVALDDTTQGGE